MPPRRHKLPRPCPKCGQKYGTIQLVVFNNRHYSSSNRVIVRIRHYDPEHYKKIKEWDIFPAVRYSKPKLRASPWHSFYTHHLLFFHQDGNKIPLEKYFEYNQDEIFDKSRSFKPPESFLNVVKRYGWRMVKRKK